MSLFVYFIIKISKLSCFVCDFYKYMCVYVHIAEYINHLCYMFASLWRQLLERSWYVLLLINCTVFPNIYVWSYWGEYIREICQLHEIINNQQAVAIISLCIPDYFYYFTTTLIFLRKLGRIRLYRFRDIIIILLSVTVSVY